MVANRVYILCFCVVLIFYILLSIVGVRRWQEDPDAVHYDPLMGGIENELSKRVKMSNLTPQEENLESGVVPLYNETITLYGLGVEYIKQKAVKGNIGKFLKEFKNPCWFEGTVSRDGIRCLPYFYELGVAKCGTHSLATIINGHPKIFSMGKEPNYWFTRFRDTSGHSLDSYIHRLQNMSYIIYDDLNKKTGYHDIITPDSTPQLLSRGQSNHPDNINSQKEPLYTLAHTLYALNPKTLFIVTMRDPTDRLFSDYHHHNRENISNADFHNWSKRAITMMNDCLSKRTLRSCAFDTELNAVINEPDQKYTYGIFNRFSFSLYYPYVKEFLSVFPRDQMYFIKAEDMYCNVETIMTEMYSFLGLDDLPEELKRHEVGHMNTRCNHAARAVEEGTSYRNYMTTETKAMLDDFFSPYNHQLAELLQDDKWLFK